MIEHAVLLSVPGLRPRDVHDPRVTPSLYRLMHAGGWRAMVPTFPCLDGPVEASMLTGAGPGEHGVVGNTGRDALGRPTFHTVLRRHSRKLKSSSWFAHLAGASGADYTCRPLSADTRHGARSPACETQPESFYRQIARPVGPFPLAPWSSREPDIEITEWICDSAVWLTRRRKPAFQHIRLPHLALAGKRYGPNSPETFKALSELDAVVDDLISGVDEITGMEKTLWIVAGGYAMTDVRQVVAPNRLLHDAGMLATTENAVGEMEVDIARSDARAVVDGQVAHVHVRRGQIEQVVEVFSRQDGVGDVVFGRERAGVGLEHENAAPVILIARPDCCFAPGLDDVVIRGGNGAPAVMPEQHAMLMCTHSRWLDALPTPTRDVDVFRLLCRALGVGDLA